MNRQTKIFVMIEYTDFYIEYQIQNNNKVKNYY